jgi:hypothetical protein
MRVLTSFDEVEEASGTRIGTSDWFDVTDEQLRQFNRAVALDGAPGADHYLSISMIPALASTVYRVETPGARINHGVDHAGFVSALAPGSRIRSEVNLIGVKRTAIGLQLTTSTEIEIEGADPSACEAVTLTLLHGPASTPNESAQ